MAQQTSGNESESSEMSDSAEAVSLTDPNPRAKKPKRDVHFNVRWKSVYRWLSEGQDNYSAKCRLCCSEFTISHGGENDVKKHMKTGKHLKHVAKPTSSRSITDFYTTTKTDSGEKNSVAAAETIEVYHTINHSLGYVSCDCQGKLFPKMFSDSKITEKYSCGKTKATKIVQNVLGPESKKRILVDLENHRFFSIGTDASNKGTAFFFTAIQTYYFFCFFFQET